MFVHSMCYSRLRLVWITICTSTWAQNYKFNTFRYLFRKHTACLTCISAPWIVASTLNGQTFWDGDHHGKFVRFVRKKLAILRRRIKFGNSCAVLVQTLSCTKLSPSLFPLSTFLSYQHSFSGLCKQIFPSQASSVTSLCVPLWDTEYSNFPQVGIEAAVTAKVSSNPWDILNRTELESYQWFLEPHCK